MQDDETKSDTYEKINGSDLIKIDRKELTELVDFNPLTGIFTLRKNVPHSNRWPGQSIALERDGRMVINLKGRSWVAARLAFLYMAGYIPKYVRHLNGNPKDLRWCNLAGMEAAPKPAVVPGEKVDLEAYTPRKVQCVHCKNHWIAQFDLSVAWLRCQICQKVLHGDELRKQVSYIQTLKDLPRQ